MGEINLPEKAKLFIGIIGQNEDVILEARDILINKYGNIDLESELFDFSLTTYYEKEMGKNLKKKFYSFKKLINRDEIVEIKIDTNDIENQLMKKHNTAGRVVNLDPGYLTLSNITLASTKDFYHRIYLRKGIFLENTLYYNARRKTYLDWEWTFPDFRQESYKKFFVQVRNIYRDQLKYEENFERKF